MGRYDPDVDLDGGYAAYTLYLLLLKDAQKYDLRIQGQFSSFIEKDRTTVGTFKPAALHGQSAREGALFMSKKFTIQEAVGNGTAVNFDKRAIHSGGKEIGKTGKRHLSYGCGHL